MPVYTLCAVHPWQGVPEQVGRTGLLSTGPPGTQRNPRPPWLIELSVAVGINILFCAVPEGNHWSRMAAECLGRAQCSQDLPVLLLFDLNKYKLQCKHPHVARVAAPDSAGQHRSPRVPHSARKLMARFT